MSLREYLRTKTGICCLVAGITFGATAQPEMKNETSDVMHETATVVARIYHPAQEETTENLTIINIGPIGIDAEGRSGLSIGGITYASEELPEQYEIIFRWKNGTLTSKGGEKQHKELYEKLREGQEVDLAYKELYRTTYDDIDRDGKQDLIEKLVTGYSIIDANPKKQ